MEKTGRQPDFSALSRALGHFPRDVSTTFIPLYPTDSLFLLVSVADLGFLGPSLTLRGHTLEEAPLGHF